MKFVSRVRHGHINDVWCAFGCFQNIFTARIWNAHHGKQAAPLRDSAQVGRFGEGDMRVLHLNPHYGKTKISAHFNENWIVEIYCRSQEWARFLLFKKVLQSSHWFSLLLADAYSVY